MIQTYVCVGVSPEPSGARGGHSHGNLRRQRACESVSVAMTTKDEVKHLVRLYDGNVPQLLTLLSGQLQVLKGQGQMLLGLCGITITVTGFSGHNMVRAGLFSTTCMVAGLAIILLAILLTLRALARIAWVSADLDEDVEKTVSRVILRRDGQQRALQRAAVAVTLGFALYTAAVAVAALSGSPWSPP